MSDIAITKVTVSNNHINTKDKIKISVDVKNVRKEGSYLAFRLAQILRGKN